MFHLSSFPAGVYNYSSNVRCVFRNTKRQCYTKWRHCGNVTVD